MLIAVAVVALVAIPNYASIKQGSDSYIGYEDDDSLYWEEDSLYVGIDTLGEDSLYWEEDSLMFDVDSLATDSAVEECIVELTPEFIEAVQKYDELDEFSEGFAAVKRNGKWGFINNLGEEVITCQYDDTTPFREGKAAVKRGRQWGYINKEDEVVVPFFTAVFANVFSEGYAFTLRDDGYEGDYKYRVIDEQGKTAFSGLIDVYSFISPALESIYFRKYCPTFKDGMIHIDGTYYDSDGRELYSGEPEHEGEYTLFWKEEGGVTLYGIKDSYGSIVVPARYSFIPQASWGKVDAPNGVVLVKMTSDNVADYFGYDFFGEEPEDFFCKKDYYGYVDLNGNDTFPETLKARCIRAMKQAWQKLKVKDPRL